jgi:anti-sigma regulatory factor (Ser/Thr protein kinase)
MKELSLHILDITKNSVSAGAAHIRLSLTETEDHVLTIVIADNGRGMSPEFLARVTDPFTTTRTTRKVGMGLPLYRMAAEQTGGSLAIESTVGVGTTVTALFHTDHLDCAPLGDLPGVIALLIQGSPLVDFTVERSTPKGSYVFSTLEVREQLGPDVPLDEPEVFLWLNDYLQELEAEV